MMRRELAALDAAFLLGRPEQPLPATRTDLARAYAGRCVLVTGAAGFIGGLVTEALLDAEVGEVRALDHHEAGLERLERHLRDAGRDKTLRVLLDDAGDAVAVRRAVDGCDLVVHAAACKQVPFAERFPRRVALENLRSVHALLRATTEEGRARFVQVSTDKVLGPGAIMGATKRAAEGLIADGAATTPHPPGRVIARLANVLRSGGNVIEVFARRLAEGRPLPLTGDAVTRLFLSEREAVDLILHAALPRSGDDGSLYAMDPGAAIPIAELGRRLAAALGRPDPVFEPLDLRPGDQAQERLFSPAEEERRRAEGPLWICPRTGIAPLAPAVLDEALRAIEGGDDGEAREWLSRLIARA